MKGVRPVCPVLSRFSVGGNVLDAPLRSQRSLSASCVLTETHASQMPISVEIGGVAIGDTIRPRNEWSASITEGRARRPSLEAHPRRCWRGCSCPSWCGNIRTETFSQATEKFAHARHSGFLS